MALWPLLKGSGSQIHNGLGSVGLDWCGGGSLDPRGVRKSSLEQQHQVITACMAVVAGCVITQPRKVDYADAQEETVLDSDNEEDSASTKVLSKFTSEFKVAMMEQFVRSICDCGLYEENKNKGKPILDCCITFANSGKVPVTELNDALNLVQQNGTRPVNRSIKASSCLCLLLTCVAIHA